MNFCGPYDKQLAKQKPPSVVTPLLAGWEFWQKPVLSADKANLMALIKTQEWAMTKSVRDEIEKDIWAVVVTDLNQTIQYVNARFEEMTGYGRHEVLGKRPAMLQGELTSPKVRQRIRDALKQQKSVREQLLNYRKDQTTYLCQVRIKPIFNRQKQLINFIAFEQKISLDERNP
ncbi:PAS domain-containing protein [Spirosoma sp. BT702]|uniref:PAS domain-containing protein n=1 Tax=Spirosoma profusum TaxID=2771354 RepID=A0A926XV98_9BACT|nr:PAS domain-containing protein [Spirosoma profusum]MBD2701254.1 PAS domain-containing protein [Spirosoma profusum]